MGKEKLSQKERAKIATNLAKFLSFFCWKLSGKNEITFVRRRLNK